MSDANVDSTFLHGNLATNKNISSNLLLGQLLGQGHHKQSRSSDKFNSGTALYTPLSVLTPPMIQHPMIYPDFLISSLPPPTSQLTPPSIMSKSQRQPKPRRSCDSSSPLLSSDSSDPQLDMNYPSCMDGKRYVCGLCLASFTFQTNLTRHQRKLHGRPFVRKPHGNDSLVQPLDHMD